MWSYLDEENTSRAAEFITDWSRFSKCCGIPETVALPWSSRDRTSDTASDWNTDLETDRQLSQYGEAARNGLRHVMPWPH